MSFLTTVCIDLDNTLIPWGDIKEIIPAFPGVSEAMWALKKAGYRIVILTSRMSPIWLDSHKEYGFKNVGAFQAHQLGLIQEILKTSNIPYDRITNDKEPSIRYFDDLGVRVSKEYPLDRAIYDFLTPSRLLGPE